MVVKQFTTVQFIELCVSSIDSGRKWLKNKAKRNRIFYFYLEKSKKWVMFLYEAVLCRTFSFDLTYLNKTYTKESKTYGCKGGKYFFTALYIYRPTLFETMKQEVMFDPSIYTISNSLLFHLWPLSTNTGELSSEEIISPVLFSQYYLVLHVRNSKDHLQVLHCLDLSQVTTSLIRLDESCLFQWITHFSQTQ